MTIISSVLDFNNPIERSFILLLALTILPTSCNNFSSQNELEKLLASDSNNLELACRKLLADKSIKDISIHKSYDSILCEGVNSWSHCAEGWETWDNKQEKQISLPFKEDVLRFENISTKNYYYFVQFLRARNLTNISRVYNCDDCIDLESELTGLQYSTNPDYILKDNYEFLNVKRISSHWFVYHRDWN